jgi:hypothetical protein
VPFSIAMTVPIQQDVPMPVLRALTESGDSYDDPSEDLLFMLLDDVDHGAGTWVIVDRPADASQQTYAQALRVAADSWVVEHREGSPETHVGTTVGDLRTAHQLLTGWAFDLAGWADGATWTPVG